MDLFALDLLSRIPWICLCCLFCLSYLALPYLFSLVLFVLAFTSRLALIVSTAYMPKISFLLLSFCFSSCFVSVLSFLVLLGLWGLVLSGLALSCLVFPFSCLVMSLSLYESLLLCLLRHTFRRNMFENNSQYDRGVNTFSPEGAPPLGNTCFVLLSCLVLPGAGLCLVFVLVSVGCSSTAPV